MEVVDLFARKTLSGEVVSCGPFCVRLFLPSQVQPTVIAVEKRNIMVIRRESGLGL